MIIHGYDTTYYCSGSYTCMLTHNYIYSLPSLAIGYTDNHVHMHTAICVT